MPATVADIVRRWKDRPLPQSPAPALFGAWLVPDASRLLHRFCRSFVPRTALDLIDEGFPWARDQRLAMDPSIPDEERMAALGRLVADVRWGPNRGWADREKRAWRELWVRAETEQRPLAELKQELLTEAVLLVLGDRDRFRRIRVGSRHGSFYLREDDDSPTSVRPLDLPYSADPETAGGAPGPFAESPYRYWFRREVQDAATAILLGEAYPEPEATDDGARERLPKLLGDAVWSLPDAEANPLLELLRREAEREEASQLAKALDRATPRQRELLALIAAGATTAGAARAVGIDPSTARGQLKRLRDKVM